MNAFEQAKAHADEIVAERVAGLRLGWKLEQRREVLRAMRDQPVRTDRNQSAEALDARWTVDRLVRATIEIDRARLAITHAAAYFATRNSATQRAK